MKRRMFTKYIATGAFLGITGGSYYWLNAPREHSHLGVDLMLDKLDNLAKSSLETKGDWSVYRTFDHLAQSIDFSMNGYPTQKSALFQNTAGKLAFKVFKARGSMLHGLDEEIPGEVITDEAGDNLIALQKLKQSLLTFKQYDAEMKPHFAYGHLSKDEFALAHILHINNHLEEFKMV